MNSPQTPEEVAESLLALDGIRISPEQAAQLESEYQAGKAGEE